MASELTDHETGQAAEAADAAVLHMAPVIIEGQDDEQADSSDQPKRALVDYLNSDPLPPRSLAILRALAEQKNQAGEYARFRLAQHGVPVAPP
jgi:hypothetical protein